MSRKASSLPLKDDLEVLLVTLTKVMKPRPLVSALPSCSRTGNLTLSDCIALAKGFDFLSKSSKSEEDVVGTYFRSNPAIKLLSERYPVLEDLVIFTSLRLAYDGKKYAAVRLDFGATFSTFDTLTDIYMVYTFYSTGEASFARASLSCLLLNLLIQMVLCFFQNRNQAKGRTFREFMFILCFAKPGVGEMRRSDHFLATRF